MKYKFIAVIAALMLCASCQLNAQEPGVKPAGVVIHFSPKTDTTNLQIKYYLTAASDYSAFVTTHPGVLDYQIPASYDNRPVRSLKVIIYGPRYHAKTLTFPFPKGLKDVDIELEPIGSVPFSGQVSLPENFGGGKFRVRVMYIPLWECTFYGEKKCLQGFDNMTTAEFNNDGSFQVDLPDFAGDPAIASLRNPGKFYFAIEGGQNGQHDYYWLLSKKGNLKYNGITEAKTYPQQQFFLSEKK